MRKLITLALVAVFLAGTYIYAVDSDYDLMNPQSRSDFSEAMLEAGKSFHSNNKDKNAKACFMRCNELYPMGTNASSARDLLYTYYKIKIDYNPDKQFNFYVKRADSLSETATKVNNYLMALEIKKDKDILYKLALIYYKSDNKDKAKEYLKMAVEAGLDSKNIDDSLKSLLQ